MAKSKYDTHIAPKLDLVTEWSKAGLSMTQIAKNLGIADSTLYVHMDSHSEFSEALKRGKEEADIEIENAMFKRAKGFIQTVKRAKILSNGDIVAYEEEVYYPPDVTAQIFWLKNRKPEQWHDRRNPPDEEMDNGNIEQLIESIHQSAALYAVPKEGQKLNG